MCSQHTVTPAVRVKSHSGVSTTHSDSTVSVRVSLLCPQHTVTAAVSVNNQSINQSINLYHAIVQCGYAESKRNVLRQILNVLTDGAVGQFSGREFQSLGAATEKRRAAVSKLCGGTSVWMIAASETDCMG